VSKIFILPFILCACLITGCVNKKETPSSAAETSVRDWQKPFNRGIELRNAGNLTEASYYFSNALGSSPGNLKVIEVYCQTMISLAEKEDNSIFLLQTIEGFLQSQIPLTNCENIEKILTCLAGVRNRIETASQKEISQEAPPLDSDRENMWEDLKKQADVLPSSLQECRNELDSLISLKESISEFDSGTAEEDIEKLNQRILLLRAAIEYQNLSTVFEMHEKRVEQMIQSSTKPSLMIAAYQLQECEQDLRGLVAIQSDHLRNDSLDIQLKFEKLETLTKNLAEAKAMEAWQETNQELDQFAAARTRITTYSGKKGVCQLKLENIQQEAQKLQTIFPYLSGESLKLAEDRRNSLNEETESLINKQSKEYNTWAIDQIQKGLDECRKNEKLIINGKPGRSAIGKALITYLGSIDRRYLTSEVSRCYDEVANEYLTKDQLNPVKNENAINEEGNLLHTLHKMNETTKKPLYNF
jgi:hypothetical protein